MFTLVFMTIQSSFYAFIVNKRAGNRPRLIKRVLYHKYKTKPSYHIIRPTVK